MHYQDLDERKGVEISACYKNRKMPASACDKIIPSENEGQLGEDLLCWIKGNRTGSEVVQMRNPCAKELFACIVSDSA